jgi:hypothetical protein
LFSYSFRYVENSANEFLSYYTLKALYDKIINNKKKTDIPYFEPIVDFTFYKDQSVSEKKWSRIVELIPEDEEVIENQENDKYQKDTNDLNDTEDIKDTDNIDDTKDTKDTNKIKENENSFFLQQGILLKDDFKDLTQIYLGTDYIKELNNEINSTSNEDYYTIEYSDCDEIKNNFDKLIFRTKIKNRQKFKIKFSEIAFMDSNGECIAYMTTPTIQWCDEMFCNLKFNITLKENNNEE